MLRKSAICLLAAAFALFTSPAMATEVDVPSQGFQWPSYPINMGTLEDGTNTNTSTLSGATLKVAFCGRVYQNDLTFRNGSVTKDIHSIGWTNGSKTGTWTLQVSSQAVSVAAGPPIQPTGTILGGGLALATILSTAVTQNANNTATFTADDTGVPFGALRCFVFEYSAFTSGNDNITAPFGSDPSPWGAAQTDFNGASWTAASAGFGNTKIPNIQINFSDGTVGGFAFVMPLGYSSSTTEVLNSGSSPREIGMEFQAPFNGQINAICAAISSTTTAANGTIELTDKIATPNVLATTNFLGIQNRATGAFQGLTCFPTLVGGVPARITLTRNTSYVVGVFGTTASANNTQIFTNNIPVAASLDASFGCGRKCGRVTRSTGGTWSAISNTQMPLLAVVYCAVDDNTGP